MLFNNRPLLIAIVLFVILVVLLIITAGTNNISGAQSIVGGLLEPVQGAFYSVTDSVVGFFTSLFSSTPAEEENAQLKAQISELEAELADLTEVRAENERLTELLAFTENNASYEYIGARITGKSPSQWFGMFTINVGVASGVEKDMPVVSADGLVGRVVETGANWSRVMAITDSSSGVSGIVERTRSNGIVSGTVETMGVPQLSMELLPLNADLMPGDVVITSGLDEVFPKGLTIGTISEVSQGRDNLQTNAVVTPAADFLHLEEVLVIKGVTEDGQ